MSVPANPNSSCAGRRVRPGMSRASSIIIPATGLRIHRSSTNLPRNYTLGSEPTLPPSRSALDSDDDDDDENEASDRTPLLGGASFRRRGRIKRGRKLVKSWFARLDYEVWKRVIKCSLAYWVGSLATFVPAVSAFLGKYDGKHMVATCAVYFHPARSAGSMHEATIFALAAFLYSTIVSVGSMGVSLLFYRLKLIQLGHAIVLIVFCAGGLGLIGYTKIAMSSPTVSVACSLASISIITILTKEGSVQSGDFTMGKIYQVSTIVIMSIVISNFLAFTLWPTSAIGELRQLMIRSTDSFSAMLTIITRSFLNGSEDELLGERFKSATANHRTVFTSLIKNLKEAKYEHYLRGTEQEYKVEKQLIDCMQRLAQHIGGLRSAASTQFTLLATAQEHQANAKSDGTNEGIPMSPPEDTTDGPQLFTPPDHDGAAIPPPISEVASIAGSDTTAPEEDPAAPIRIFDQFIFHLGPPMKSLAYTLKLILDDLSFISGKTYRLQVNREFRGSLGQAIALYSERRIEALNTLYKSKAVTKERPMAEAADVEEIAASCGYFSYCLLYFAEEMLVYLSLLEELEDLQTRKTRSWEWAKFWKSKKSRKTTEEENLAPTNGASNTGDFTLKRTKTIPNVAPEVGVPFTYKVWKALSLFRRRNVRFSIKVGVGAAIYALPAFIPQTRPIYSHWRGEWGLVSYMIVMSMTLGQTNNSGKARVLGTLAGTVLALFAWLVFSPNPYTLSLFGWLVSIPCFWIILTWKQATFGRFILLTYNLSVLYAYSLATSSAEGGDDDDDEGGTSPIITEIALHRSVAVTAGVLWGVFINIAIWPTSARNQLRNGLGVLWLRMALIWRHDPLLSLLEPATTAPTNTYHQNRPNQNKYMDITEEHALQSALLRLGRLTASAPHEFRLKGPFPEKDYKDLIMASQAMLDAFHGMAVMIAKDPCANRREAEILAHTRREREDLCARISHLFYVLAGSIKLGFPLPASLPKTDRARDRLLASLFEFRKRVRGTEGDSDEDFALIYAYALVTGRISEGLLDAVATVERLYGVLEEEMLVI
ncbi:Fusaric acid resistance protein-like-domain-containing protein [Tuber borchii]|uniref:Fusaric acid resistance protein-like-domain-containing protein n=1 Tax=Tuber borchii TaxID=42251 RepID=A0A2T6ZA60_TUBBO|nr:Fusaric acid resistance protein-like-domain-containing protein [Tuber borchii]